MATRTRVASGATVLACLVVFLPPSRGEEPEWRPREVDPAALPGTPRRPYRVLRSPDGTLLGDQTWLIHGRAEGDDDADGLTNEEEEEWGTERLVPDSDGDGLLDGWEVHGVDGTPLRKLGADPRVKDIFVEMDYMRKPGSPDALPPSEEVMAAIRAAFAAAPTVNHDGSKGIRVHLELAQEVAYQEAMSLFGFLACKKVNFDVETRGRAFHYMIWANALDQPGYPAKSSGASLGVPGSDFVVTLGRWNRGRGGDDAAKIGCFLHELGHNLGLEHGGTDAVTYKPNHLSVMNYRWQSTGLRRKDRTTLWTYQWCDLHALHESSLNEKIGIGLPLPSTGLRTCWGSATAPEPSVEAEGPIDWNRTPPENETARVDLNGDGDKLDILGETINEWRCLNFKGGTIGSKEPLRRMRERALTLPPTITVERYNEAQAWRDRLAMGFK